MGFVFLPGVCVGCPVLALSWLVGCALRVVRACVFECSRAGWSLNLSRRGSAGGRRGHGGRVSVGVFACGCRKAGEGNLFGWFPSPSFLVWSR